MGIRGATQAEIKKGLVLCEYFKSAADVVKGGGEIVGSVEFDGRGVVLPATTNPSNDYVILRLNPNDLAGLNSNDFITFVCEFYPRYNYDVNTKWSILYNTTVMNILKNKLSNGNRLQMSWGGRFIDALETTEYGPHWVINGRNQFVFSTISGNTNIWFNNIRFTTLDGSTYLQVMDIEEIFVGVKDVLGTNPFPGTISMIKAFKGPKFTDEDVDALWNNKIITSPSNAEGYWFFDNDRYLPGSNTVLDATKGGFDLTLGDGVTGTTFPTKLDRHGFSFDGGDNLRATNGPSFSGSDDITIESEFNVDNNVGKHVIGGRVSNANNPNWMFRTSNGIIQFLYRNETNTANRVWSSTSVEIIPGRRYHIVFRHTFGNDSVAKCFLNGIEIAGAWGIGATELALYTPTLQMQIGSREPGVHHFYGKIYMFGIWKERFSDIQCFELWLKSLRRTNYV